MDEFAIRLKPLAGVVNLGQLTQISFDFSDAAMPGEKAVVLVGEVKLVGYGA